MATDFFGDSPNFVNPAYVTPEQKAMQRAYAAALMKRSGETATRPAGVFANMIDALTSRLEMNRAGNLEQQGGAMAQRGDEALIAALQNRQPGVPNAPITRSGIPDVRPPSVSASPMGAPAATAMAPSAPAETPTMEPTNPQGGIFGGLNYKPLGWEGETKVASLGPAGGGGAPAGAPVVQSPAAPPAMSPQPPIQMAGGLHPSLLAAQLNNQMVSPEQKALIRGLINPSATADVYGRPAYQSYSGGIQPVQAPQGFQPGVKTTVTAGDVTVPQFVTPPTTPGQAPGGNIPGGGMGSVQPVVDFARTNAARKQSDVARAGETGTGEGGVIKADIDAAAAAPNILKDIGVIKQNIQQYGNDLTFGPTAQMSNEFKRVIANYAPGLTNPGALAAADSIEKLNLGLAGSLAKQIGSGTQGELFRAVGSVPGMEKSKQGALALIDMMQQSAQKQQKLGEIYRQYKDNLDGYAAAKQDFLTKSPIINPITGNPVEMDMANVKRTAPAGGGPVKVNSPDEARKLPSGTKIILPDGSQGVVP